MNKKSSLLNVLKSIGWVFLAASFLASLYGIFHYSTILRNELEQHGEVRTGAVLVRTMDARWIAFLGSIEIARRDGQPVGDIIKDLKGYVTLSNDLFKAYIIAAPVKTITGRTLNIRPVNTPVGMSVAQELQSIWSPLEVKIQAIMQNGENQNPEQLTEALAYAQKHSKRVVEISDILSGEENIYRDQRMAGPILIRYILVSYLTAVSVLLLPIVFLMGRIRKSNTALEESAVLLNQKNAQLAEDTRKIEEAKRESDVIMETVQEGLLLIDVKGVIGAQYSRELERIFRMENLAGFNFLNILQRILTEKMYNTTRDYLALLFDAKRKEKQILKVNPLDVVEVNFSNPEGGFITKYLGFTFRRVVEAGVVTRVFIGVGDITSRVTLERELRQSELKKEKQFDLLLGILHIEPKQVQEFIETAKKDLLEITTTLRAEDFAAASAGKIDELRDRLNVVFRCVHNIKGNASYLKLVYFQKTADEFESKINQLRNRPSLTGDDFLSIVMAQSDLRNDVEELDEIRSKLGELRIGGGTSTELFKNSDRNGNSTQSREDELIVGLRGLVTDIAQKTGKSVRLEAKDFNAESFRSDYRPLVRDVLIQLTRNSLAHSFELPAERTRVGKGIEGVIEIKPTKHEESGLNGFLFRDDGKGIDISKVRDRAISQGLITAEDAQRMAETELAMLIFTPGFSTADEVTTEAGRGMGMDIIKEKIIDECGGEITVSVEPGKHCTFGIFLPN